ncbi:translocation/assembly module TamB domain-containing protein [Christiangramia sp. SM2212]|uniref:Translocation/assembly module TamB domain-containing protein n=1 Tax=Christiangramia sediminicola TaxID=3073267 RepID=A0ABU1EPB9_9FLAO|nr:translocation/assembly module TamB domain-containing protein [Christiangramia sp. SM2212]MDR5590223.1 translocation/assembly module TamB domain-containing protein [Christiangramia sp. SM2212]
MTEARRKFFKIFKIIGKVFLGILIFLILLILFVRSPWGQNIIKDKFISSIEKDTGAKIELEKLFIQFNGDIQVDKLYIEDPAGDTIVYSESISANIPIWPLIKGNSFSLNGLDATNLKARIIRKDSIEGFNYEFLMNSFASDTTQTTTPTDTTAAPMNISIGDIDLKKIDLLYKDDVSGIDTRIRFDDLKLEFTETDLENMVFQVNNAILANAQIQYEQTKAFPESDEEPAPMPVLDIENIKLTTINGFYRSVPDSLDTDFRISSLNLENSKFDLKSNQIASDLIQLSDSDISLKMQQKAEQVESTPETNSGFEWPQWNVQIADINLDNNSFLYTVNSAVVKKGSFNPNAVKLDSLVFIAENINYKEGLADAGIQKLEFKEGSGIEVNKFNIQATVTNENMKFSDLDVAVNANSLSGNMELTYTSLNDFMKEPGKANLNLNLNNVYLNIRDIYRFQPALRQDPYMQSLDDSPIRGSLSANGKLDNISLNSLNLNWSRTQITGNGRIVNLQDPERLAFDLPNVRMRSRRSDMLKFVKEEDLGLKLPEELSITGRFAGNTSEIRTNSTLVTSDGTLKIDGDFNMGDKIVFDAEIQGDSIALGSLLQNDALGDIQLNLKASGSGSSVNDLNASLESQISSFTYKEYEFRNIDINGELENGQGPVNLIYQDENLDMEAQTTIKLDSVSPRFDFNLYMDGANLGALGITQKDIKTGFTLEGWYEGNGKDYELQAEIIDGVAVYNNKTYLLGSFDAAAYVREDTTSVKIQNRMLDLDLQSNASPVAFSEAINRHFKRYITENYQEDSIVSPVNLKLNAKISQAPILNEVFLVNLEELDTVDVVVDFRENERELDASISVPFINFYSSEIDSLKVDMRSDPSDLNFSLAFNALNAGPLAIKRTVLEGDVLNRKLNLDFSSTYEEEQLVHVKSELNFQGDTLKFHVDPQDLILNKNSWNIDNSNQLSYATEYLSFDNFRLFRNDQEMILSNNKPNVEKEHLSLDFKNFKLAAFLNYLNPEDQLATGQLNGNIVYEEPFGETGILADMAVNQFKVMNVDLNTLSLKGNSSGFSNYDFEMAVKGGEVDLDLTGSYEAADPSAILNMNLDLNEVKMTALEGFSQGEIRNGSGTFSGNFKVNGTLLEPEYEGNLDFNNAKFNIAMLNADFILPEEQLRLDNDAIYFERFNINDANNNSIVVDGKVTTVDLLNPGFDLDVQAKNFKLLNSTEEDNDLFYGSAVVDVDAQINGDLNLPKVNMNMDIKESTNFTYVVPETELQIKERDGIVIFVNKENPDDILSQTQEESYVVSGYDIFSRISVNEGATFNVIINPETGDKFQVEGEGDLIFNMYPNGRTALTGIYEINDGFYEMSLYNLVKRRFEIADGSRVSWAGDPFDAQLDVRAIYKVETSASSLMASQTSGLSAGQQQRYMQELPFLVYLNVDGDLMEPKISFGLDLPEEEQGVAGGEIFGRVQQLNNQEQELNKQVFSLLVLNRFFPESGSDGSSGGTLAVARDNLNSALSDQLNMLSNKILGESGVQLNFNVDSFTDYQGANPEERTQLGISAQKAFLEDRLIVEVGSEVDIQGGNQQGQEASPMIGNVSISYLLDENGVWRLKGFSKNQYENVIDGQLVVSGIALIFTKEFNKFQDMFEKAVMESVKNKEADTSKKEESTTDEN